MKKMLKEIIIAIPPLRVIGVSWKACGFVKSLSSKLPLILCEYLLTIRKIKKLTKAKTIKNLLQLTLFPYAFLAFIIF